MGHDGLGIAHFTRNMKYGIESTTFAVTVPRAFLYLPVPPTMAKVTPFAVYMSANPDHALSIDHALVQLFGGVEGDHEVIGCQLFDDHATEDQRAAEVSVFVFQQSIDNEELSPGLFGGGGVEFESSMSTPVPGRTRSVNSAMATSMRTVSDFVQCRMMKRC
jgi:hypothetical protein